MEDLTQNKFVANIMWKYIIIPLFMIIIILIIFIAGVQTGKYTAFQDVKSGKVEVIKWN